MIPYNGQLKTFNFDVNIKRSHHDKRKNKCLCENIMTFDIEVTSAFIHNGKIILYEPGRKSEYWNELTPLALCYLWQFSIDDKVYYGRDLNDFIQVLQDIPSNMSCIIWVHNLSYEFQFLCNILRWKTVFARSSHKVMKCTPAIFPNIEFRCTYFLTRLSLEVWGKSVGVEKKIGYLDYNKLRTPLTPLKEKELEYGEYDCLCMYAGLRVYKRKYGSVFEIPLTQTGTVRKVVKEKLTSDPEYVKFVKRLVPKNAEMYSILQDIIAGGYSHANRLYSGIPIYGLIEHYDFASSYPYVMCVEKYPMTPWLYIGKPDLSELDFNENAYIIDVTLHGLNSLTYNTYIQASKICSGKNCKYDNGRLIKADEITIKVTEQDWITITNTYKIDRIIINGCYKSKKDYLPLDFVMYVLELYGNKTLLKNVEEMAELYTQSKQYINSLYGMMITAILQADVVFSNGDWTINKLTAEMVNEKLKKLADKNQREKRYFLSYSWGIWVLAYARRNLWTCIEKEDEDNLYNDTDASFLIGEHDFTWYNDIVDSKVNKVCSDRGIDVNLFRPVKDGKCYPLGYFTKEEDCTEFLTLGAKRYVERRKKDGKLHLTVSGINKEAVALLNDDITNFKDGFIFDKDSEYVKKMHLTYMNDMPNIEYPDGYISTYKYGINMRPDQYKLSITDEYKLLIKYAEIDLGDIPENYETALRGRFS